MNPLRRFVSATPGFWRKVQVLSLGLLAAVKALQAAPESIPAGLVPYLGYAFAVLTTITVTAQFTCTDHGRSDQPAAPDPGQEG
ncbi:hypothetical protein LJ737_19895 [Hymenobacter sp. 15J16-1T3B]|uniref:hypothetical protein n=1 Tax=Hymenobacter sp. 15J16-1T3B TaxID=2886941 RepID=UPI001D10E59E|nr:hypothetical protein [Hymenobacter sp. 15J16-1T3B]MCC3159515.1 hypothetical protein [Hymenobacter sp. 15J16-1T3B]